MLAPQSFSHSCLLRSVDKRDAGALAQALRACSLLFVQGREIYVAGGGPGGAFELAWTRLPDLAALGLAVEGGSVRVTDSGAQVPAYLLGKDTGSGDFVLALDLGAGGPLGERLGPLLRARGWEPRDLRSLLAALPAPQLGVAGQAVALAQWHQGHGFCPRCGSPMDAVEAGSKRACRADPRHRVYPRTDPVVIMLIESPDGSRALLGRPQTLKSRGPFLTCLSGFVEQGESLEDAVRREVKEEAGIDVGDVQIVGSQPWPLGRGGTCELMIGCSGKALGDELHTDFSEMADVRWVDREAIAYAVEDAKRPRDPFTSPLPDDSRIDFFIPPPYAIANHLIAAWLARGPFFPPRL